MGLTMPEYICNACPGCSLAPPQQQPQPAGDQPLDVLCLAAPLLLPQLAPLPPPARLHRQGPVQDPEGYTEGGQDRQEAKLHWDALAKN